MFAYHLISLYFVSVCMFICFGSLEIWRNFKFDYISTNYIAFSFAIRLHTMQKRADEQKQTSAAVIRISNIFRVFIYGFSLINKSNS